MARRIKEEPIVHKNRIADQAEELFKKRGIDGTTMDDIAGAAGYSKATLYVYFKNKEEIISFLTLRSMTKLRDVISMALGKKENSKEAFFELCFALVEFQREYPTFFERSLAYISIDFETKDAGFDQQTYIVGEEINKLIADFIEQGIKNGELKKCDKYFIATFQMWGMISGLIKLACEKEQYILQAGGLTKQEFLEDGFEKVYETIAI